MLSRIQDRYFDWLVDIVSRDRFSKQISFNKLLTQLHNTEFEYTIPFDQNRALDGVDLRYRFAMDCGYDESILYDLSGECSVLEMLVALSIRCEEFIMDDPRKGNRTGQWFWGMIANLGLNSCYDSNYDTEYVDYILDRFFYHEYSADGKGGLFTVSDSDLDMRTIEIWRQLMEYLNSILD